MTFNTGGTRTCVHLHASYPLYNRTADADDLADDLNYVHEDKHWAIQQVAETP